MPARSFLFLSLKCFDVGLVTYGAGLWLGCWLVACSHLPGGVHELNKVLIIVDAGGNGCVVVVPLGMGDLAIVVLVTERGEELNEDLILGHLTRDNLGVLGAVVDTGEVAGGDNIIGVITVELGESLVDDGLADFVGLATETNEELIEGNETVRVDIEGVDKDASFLLGEGASHVLKAPVELLLVQFAVTVVINDLEGAAD